MQALCPVLGVNAGEQLRASVECSNLTTTPATKERWKDSVRAIKAAFEDGFQTHVVQRSDDKHSGTNQESFTALQSPSEFQKGKTLMKKCGKVIQVLEIPKSQLIWRMVCKKKELSAAVEVRQEGSVRLMRPWPCVASWPQFLPVFFWHNI